MQTELRQFLGSEVVDGFANNELYAKDIIGPHGKLTIQPEHQHRSANGG